MVIPNDSRIGISKKITDPEERQRIKNVVREVLPEGYGVIVRTDGEGKSDETYKEEIERLIKRSEDVLNRSKSVSYTHLNGKYR